MWGWVRYAEAEESGSGAIIKPPQIAAYVERVYANEHGPSGCVAGVGDGVRLPLPFPHRPHWCLGLRQ